MTRKNMDDDDTNNANTNLSSVLTFLEATYRLTLGCHDTSLLSFVLIFKMLLFFKLFALNYV